MQTLPKERRYETLSTSHCMMLRLLSKSNYMIDQGYIPGVGGKVLLIQAATGHCGSYLCSTLAQLTK